MITNHQEMIPCQLVLPAQELAPALGLAKSCANLYKFKVAFRS